MFNVHTHIFTVKDVPVDFLKDAGINPAIARTMVRNLQAGGNRRRLAEWLIRKTPQGKKYQAFISIGSQDSMSMVFDSLRFKNDYPEGTKFVALPMQFEKMGCGAMEWHNYEDQIAELARTKAEHAEVLYPFYAVDPRMGVNEDDVLSYVKKNLTMAMPYKQDEKGIEVFTRVFYGIKIYPSLGFFPYDRRLRATYGYAQEHSLPIMTHCSRGGVYFSDPIKTLETVLAPDSMNRVTPDLLAYNPATPDRPRMEPKYAYPGVADPKTKNEEFCDYFLDPENYRDALGLFPNLKVCFAHFGSDSEIATKLNITIGDPNDKDKTVPAPGSPRDDTWYDKIIALLKRREYPNLFTDISYTLHIPEFRKLVKDEVENDLKLNGTNKLDDRLISKILFGTDFFMVYREKDESEKKLVNAARKDFMYIDPVQYPNLASLGTSAFWDYMTVKNPKRYLSSKFATF